MNTILKLQAYRLSCRLGRGAAQLVVIDRHINWGCKQNQYTVCYSNVMLLWTALCFRMSYSMAAGQWSVHKCRHIMKRGAWKEILRRIQYNRPSELFMGHQDTRLDRLHASWACTKIGYLQRPLAAYRPLR